MERTKKVELVTALHETFSQATLVIVTHQAGLSVADANRLRQRMREVGARYRVTKNRLARRAVEGTPNEALADLFRGPTAIAWSADPVAAAKAAVDFAKTTDKLTIIGGVLQGHLLDRGAVQSLAALPSLDELRARLIGLINAPATKLAVVLQAPAGQLARVLRAYADKQDAA